MIVADTNLIAYLLIAGPFSHAAQRVFDRDGDWIAPSLWQYELLNVLATSVRAGHLDYPRALEVWAQAPAFVKDAVVPPLEVLDLSVATKFAAYDCFYVVLARSLAVPLVTADKQLLAQFGDVAVGIETFAGAN